MWKNALISGSTFGALGIVIHWPAGYGLLFGVTLSIISTISKIMLETDNSWEQFKVVVKGLLTIVIVGVITDIVEHIGLIPTTVALGAVIGSIYTQTRTTQIIGIVIGGTLGIIASAEFGMTAFFWNNSTNGTLKIAAIIICVIGFSATFSQKNSNIYKMIGYPIATVTSIIVSAINLILGVTAKIIQIATLNGLGTPIGKMLSDFSKSRMENKPFFSTTPKLFCNKCSGNGWYEKRLYLSDYNDDWRSEGAFFCDCEKGRELEGKGYIIRFDSLNGSPQLHKPER